MKRTALQAACMAWMGLIFIASSLPGSVAGSETPEGILLRKVVHFVIFGILALLLLGWLGGSRAFDRKRAALLAVSLAATMLYAMSDEFHQKFTPGRHASWADVGIDSAGAAVVLLSAELARRRTVLPGKGVGSHGKTADRR